VPSERGPGEPRPGRSDPEVVAVLVAYVGATIVSGLPSTVWAFARGDDPLAAVRAAGTLLPGRRRRPSVLGGTMVHAAVSAFWTAALSVAARRWPLTPVRGALAGLAIAALDLGVIGRRYPAIAALDTPAQLADHAMFGAVVVHLLGRRGCSNPSVEWWATSCERGVPRDRGCTGRVHRPRPGPRGGARTAQIAVPRSGQSGGRSTDRNVRGLDTVVPRPDSAVRSVAA